LAYLGERIQINRQPIPPQALLGSLQAIDAVAQQLQQQGLRQPSFFEYMTAAAFLYFKDQKVDIAIIETGLGGTLDATNVITQPLVCAITSIGYDHQAFLGPTLHDIAKAKGGIIKPQVPVVLGVMPAVAQRVIQAQAAAQGSACYTVREQWKGKPYPCSSLKGPHQRANAATATLTARLAAQQLGGLQLPIAQGLQEVFWPGRWQEGRLGKQRVILEGAHNPQGARALKALLAQHCLPAQQRNSSQTGLWVALGSCQPQHAKALARVLWPYADRLYLVKSSNERALDPSALALCLPPCDNPGQPLVLPASVSDLLELCQTQPAAASLLVTGSLYLIGDVLAQAAQSNNPELSRDAHLFLGYEKLNFNAHLDLGASFQDLGLGGAASPLLG
jgi:dihydrofolate synthase/folylpolyglutamate synthase